MGGDRRWKVTKMTKREFLNSIINGTLNDETAAFAAHELEVMANAQAKRKDKPTKAQLENAELANALFETMDARTYTATEIVGLGVEGIGSTPKATAVLKVLVADGRVKVGEGRSKNSIINTYTKA